MMLKDILSSAISPALEILPPKMDTPEARVMLLATGLQESRFQFRHQVGGPAHGFWQFEEGTQKTRGGIWGVYLHQASSSPLMNLCTVRGIAFTPDAIYKAIETDDLLAAGVARLMLYTDPKPLPAVGDTPGGWATYLRIWRPGKPHPETWPALHAQAQQEITA